MSSDSDSAKKGILTSVEQAIVDDEVAMAVRVSRRIARSMAEVRVVHPRPGVQSFEEEMTSLRDQIGEARNEDVPALMAEMQRLAAVRAVGPAKRQGMADPKVPYFGHMRLEEDGRSRDVLIGKRSMVDRKAGVVIVDWRNAPVSRLFYRYDEGDDYEEELGDRVREGLMTVRRTVSFKNAELTRVSSPDGVFILKDDDSGQQWVALPKLEAPELKGGAGSATRAPVHKSKRDQTRLGQSGPDHLRPDKHLPEIAALIDRSQFEGMTQSDSGVVILQGGAGSGKTTVALHRIAYLCFNDPQRYRARRCLVVVYQPALVRYVERVLPALDVAEVQVRAYTAWAKWAVSRIISKHSRQFIGDDVPPEVAKLKKHPYILKAIEAQVKRRIVVFEDALDVGIGDRQGRDDIMAAWQKTQATQRLHPRLSHFKRLLQNIDAPEDTLERAARAVTDCLTRSSRLLEEWEELITDARLLEGVMNSEDLPSKNLTQGEFDRALKWTKEQIQDRDEHDDEEDETNAKSLDAHDYPLLLNLWIARAGGLVIREGKGKGKNRRGKKRPRRGEGASEIRYDHICVDEAQDLSAVELYPLLVTSGQERSITLAGDIVQKVVFDNGFDEWPTLMKQLGTEATEVEPFRLTYRSTQEVAEFAQHVLGDLAATTPVQSVRHGGPVEIFSFADPGEELGFLAENLRSVMGREPRANIALLTRFPERSRFYAEMLRVAEVPYVRLVDGPDFSFLPGIDVTHISQVKGLEYDYVILAEVTRAMYPAEVASRHLLHIAATRAAFQLWVTTIEGQESLLLPKAKLS